MASGFRIVLSAVEVLTIDDQSVKNKWKANWLSEEVTVIINKKERRQLIGDSIAKISIPGQPVCTWCDNGHCVVKYGLGGKNVLVLKVFKSVLCVCDCYTLHFCLKC
ncbi:hypothetical protein V1264_014273 [Littorina saxatilis]|uniref:Uncharacterized protein n=1 Tax=Littorina saxatilis TaxID=31220 RepID=A0AAN9GKU4_9CAEN